MSTIDLCFFHLSHILWWLSLYNNFYFSLFCSTIWGNTKSRDHSCSVRICVLRNFAKFTGKHLCQSLFLNKVTYSMGDFLSNQISSRDEILSFHLWMKLTCKPKFFGPGISFIPGWDFVSVAYKRTLVFIKVRPRYFAIMNDLWVNNKRWLDKSSKL